MNHSDWDHVEVVHSIAGRVRLRVSGLRKQPELARRLSQELSSLNCLRSFEINPRSSSAVLWYAPDEQSEVCLSIRSIFPHLRDLDARAHSQSVASSRRSVHGNHSTAKSIASRARQLNEDVEAATGGMDLRILIPTLLLVLSVLGFAAGAVKNRKLPVPAWYELLWFAFNTFVILNMAALQRSEFESPEQTEAVGESH